MEKIKLSNHQIFALTSSFTCGSAILVISAGVTGLAKQDAWISAIFALIFAMFEIWMICFLWSKYPGKTYVEMIQKIFGKWIGWIVAAGFIALCFSNIPQDLWYMSNFVTSQAMVETPRYAIDFVFLAVILIGVLYGLETISRAYEIFIYIVSGLFILAMVLVLPNINVENLLPVFEEGIIPSLKGTLSLSSFLVLPIITFLMIYPSNADNTKSAKKTFFKGYLWGWFLIFISIIMSILVLGATINSDLQYPIYLLSKEINVGNIFTRLEFLVAAAWTITLLARAILYFYVGTIGISQLFGLNKYKVLVLPLGLIVFLVAEITFPNVIYQSNWDTLIWPPYIATFALFLPILLILIFLIKKHIFKMNVEGDGFGEN